MLVLAVGVAAAFAAQSAVLVAGAYWEQWPIEKEHWTLGK